MKMLSSFTYPHVVPNLYKFLSYVEHKRKYFEEFWILWKSMGTINFSITDIPQNIFCVQHKKETHAGLELHEGE